MGWLSLFSIAVALALDAFAVAIVTGLTLERVTGRQVLRMAALFGMFQALMPAAGWAAGTSVHQFIAPFDHWVAFALLLFVGGKMIHNAFGEWRPDLRVADPTLGWHVVVLSVATSIDALAVGLSLAIIGAAILVPAILIGVVAASFTASGMVLGRRVGAVWGRRVEFAGGLILIGIGAKIVLEHTLA